MTDTPTTDIARLTAAGMARKIKKGQLSPVDVVDACLARIESHNVTINAMVTLSESSRHEAKRAQEAVARGDELGLLHGVPVGIKDVTETAGLLTTYGSPLYADHVPTDDALVVQRLKQAGAIIIGKTNTPEFATGGNTFNEVFGRTRNPWNTDLSAGGSTGGGAAALASGMIALAEGTDLGGSLRIPASFCGVVGLRGSPGLVPSWPSRYPFDLLEVTGGMARTTEDLALMLQAIAGPSPLSPIGRSMAGRDLVAAATKGIGKGRRVAYCPDIANIGIDGEIEAVCRQTAMELKQLGAEVEEIELDLSYGRQSFAILRALWMVATHRHRFDKLDQLGDNVAGNIRRGLEITARDFGLAETLRGRLWDEMRRLFESFDVLLTPCMAVPPFPVEKNFPDTIGGKPMATYIDWVAPTFVLSLTSLPVGSVPAGLDPNGLPVGLQVVGPLNGEEIVLGVAGEIERIAPVGMPDL